MISYTFLFRHLEVAGSKKRKKRYNEKITRNARDQFPILARYLIDHDVTSPIICSTYTRSQESGFGTRNFMNYLLKTDRFKNFVSPLFDEWRIPALPGEYFENLGEYFTWRRQVFDVVTPDLETPFDEDSESYLDMYRRVDLELDFLESIPGNKAVYGHSQNIATILTRIKNGPARFDKNGRLVSPTASTIISDFGEFFPKEYGSLAIIAFDDVTKMWSIVSYGDVSYLVPKSR